MRYRILGETEILPAQTKEQSGASGGLGEIGTMAAATNAEDLAPGSERAAESSESAADD